MSLVIDREALDPSDLPSDDSLAAHAKKTRSKAILLAGVLFGLVGLTIVALRAPGSACAVGAVALVLVVVAAWLVVSVMGDFVVLRMMRGEHRAIEAVRQGGFVEVLRLTPDRAWLAHPMDEDSVALLLRCGERYLYLNEPLDDLVQEQDDSTSGGEDDSVVDEALGANAPNDDSAAAPPRRPRVREIVEIRRLPAPDGRVLDVVTGTRWLPLGDLPSIADADPQLAKIAARFDWSCAVLSVDELPTAWSEPVGQH